MTDASLSPLYLAQSAVGPNMLIQILPFILIFVVFYFVLIRPQKRRVQQHQEMINNVRRGDSITTNGGLIGKVTKVTEDPEIQIEIAEGVRVKVMRTMIADVRVKGDAASEEK